MCISNITLNKDIGVCHDCMELIDRLVFCPAIPGYMLIDKYDRLFTYIINYIDNTFLGKYSIKYRN